MSHVNISKNINLHTIKFLRIVRRTPYTAWISSLLSRVTSNVREVSFQCNADLQTVDWSTIDRVLEQASYTQLEKVEFLFPNIELALRKKAIQQYVASEMAQCNDRELLIVDEARLSNSMKIQIPLRWWRGDLWSFERLYRDDEAC